MKLISWNVNGLRAVLNKGFLEFFERERPDILCLQEIKARPDQVDALGVTWPEGYEVIWNPADKAGYSGTLMFTRQAPVSVSLGLGKKLDDREGRVISAEFDDFHAVTVYTPNVKDGLTRLPYREQEWDPAFLAHVKKLARKKPVLFGGDLNVAHREIDLARPKENVGNPGFTPEERAGMDKIVAAGFVDTFRHFEPGPEHYSWWSFRANARARNVGWRIDYWLASAELRSRLKRAWIMPEVTGSDHCPVGVELS